MDPWSLFPYWMKLPTTRKEYRGSKTSYNSAGTNGQGCDKIIRS